MAYYKAGSLELALIGVSNDVIKNLDAVIERLSVIQKNLGSMSQFSRASSRGNGGKTQQGTRTEKTYNISKTGKQYLTLSKEITKAEGRTSSITKQFNKQGKVIKQTSVDIDKYGNKVTKIFGVTNKSSHSGFFNIAKMAIFIRMFSRLGKKMGDIIQSGSDYLETMNLWQVAMRKNLDIADEFVKKMNKAYGVSAKTTMQAQATFKNMIGSLGDLSDETAYKLSEAITQMAFDYSSLYNVKVKQAVEKFQSALAGQVRPIRSVSGYDITEKTIHNLYRSIGGTKTQRQLSRTEKQLLAILAVFKQMQASGATGDLAKTLNLYANQSRMMTENFAELKSWTGMLLVDLIETWGVMIKINALLITATEIIKAIAKSRGVGDKNFVDGIWESAEGANEAVDELQGKLLDFDKFRSLSGQETGLDVAIDQKLLEAISGYTSNIDRAENSSREIAKEWAKILGFTIDANGEWETSDENLKNIENTIKTIGIIFGVVFGVTIIASIVKFGAFLKTNAIVPLINLGKTIAVNVLIPMAKFYWNLGVKAGEALLNYSKALFTAIGAQNIMRMGIVLLIANVAALALGWDKMNNIERFIGILGAVGAVALAAAAAVAAFNNSWTMGTATVAIVGGLAAIAGAFVSFKASMKDLDFFANGAGDIDGGTLFVAGEMGKTEAVYTGSNGKTNVANVKQMEQAFYNALSRHSKDGNGTIVVHTYLDGEELYSNTTKHAKRRGNVWAKA